MNISKILLKYKQTSRGFALISLLWIVLGISCVLYAGIYLLRLELRQSDYLFKDTKLLNASLAGIEKAKVNLTAGNINSFEFDIDGIFVSVKIEDEESKFNLNKADHFRLKRFALFDKEVNKEELIDSLLDWIDTDNLTRHFGNEKGVKNGNFDTLDELYEIKGFDINKDFVPKLKNYVTIYSNGLININTASLEVLLTLPNLNYVMVQNIINFRLGKDLEKGTKDDGVFGSVNDISYFTGEDFFKGGLITVDSQNFKVNIVAKEKKHKKKAEAMLTRIGKMVYIKYWREF